MAVNIEQIEIRYRPDSKKLLFKGGENDLVLIKHKFIKFVEQEQFKLNKKVDIALKSRRR